ncbi:MAG: RES family NAD+ phosphorylase [Anaerolineales bacterium]
MTLRAWRIVKRKHSRDAFNGEGARRFGGRWNSPGAPVVYTAEHVSLAVLEILVHLQFGSLLQEYVLFRVDFEQTFVEILEVSALPKNWRTYPAPLSLRALGDQWIADSRSAVLSVPSAIVPIERHFLLNPQHADFTRIKVGQSQPFSFDARLLKP